MTLHIAYRVFYEKRARARSPFEGGQWATGTACLLPYSFLLAPSSFFPFSFSCFSLCKFSPFRGDKNSLFNLTRGNKLLSGLQCIKLSGDSSCHNYIFNWQSKPHKRYVSAALNFSVRNFSFSNIKNLRVLFKSHVCKCFAIQLHKFKTKHMYFNCNSFFTSNN